MTYHLTADMLRSKNACEKQVMMFESEWPNGMPLDESVVPRIVDLKLSVNWFAENFLKPAAWDEYKRAKDTAWYEYYRVIATTLAEYERAKAAAWNEYERAKATAAIRIYREQEGK